MPLTSAPPLPVDEAQRRILERVRPLDAERVAVPDMLDRVAAEDVRAALDLPPWDNSAMDGYAVRADEVAPGVELDVTLGQGFHFARPQSFAETVRQTVAMPAPVEAKTRA